MKRIRVSIFHILQAFGKCVATDFRFSRVVVCAAARLRRLQKSTPLATLPQRRPPCPPLTCRMSLRASNGEYGDVEKRCLSPEKARPADPPLTPLSIPTPAFPKGELLSPTSHRPPEVRSPLFRVLSHSFRVCLASARPFFERLAEPRPTALPPPLSSSHPLTTTPKLTPFSRVQALLEPYRYLEQTQGKGMRDLLIDAFNVWFKISDLELTKIKYIVRMLHNASLLYVGAERRKR